mmetsp:Transcript_28786/g.56537  ORF Transcript_28786/g.56537 Transcript_28786/m.56537 type:complete len:187 (+) Transcript_28786:116-676(+)
MRLSVFLGVFLLSSVVYGNYIVLSGFTLSSPPTPATGHVGFTSNDEQIKINFDDKNLLMMACDIISDFRCDSFNIVSDGPGAGNELKSFLPSDGNTSYLRTDRCGEKQPATLITSFYNHTYKYCPNRNNNNRVSHTYQIPPSACEKYCDDDLSCVGYTVDNNNCYIWYAVDGSVCDPNCDAYFRIS